LFTPPIPEFQSLSEIINTFVMPPQHESCHDETMSSTSATMVSPSSMPSELKGTMSNANHQDSHYSPALEKDSLFVEDLRDV